MGWGRRIAFAGSVALALLALAVPAQAAFPGNNGKIAFFSNRSSASAYSMNPDGSAPAPLPGGAGGVWSPDGKKLLRNAGGGYAWVFESDGTFLYELELTPELTGLSWSPENDKITWSAFFCGASICYFHGIGTATEDGTTVTTMTDDHDENPAWSPDGSRIAFVTYRHDPNHDHVPDSPPNCSPCNTELYVMNADGTGQVRLTTGAGFEAWPNWSPDGSKIVFQSSRDDPHPDGCSFNACNFEIYTVNADGTGTTRLTTSSARDTNPVWSPDGMKIAFGSNRDGNNEIYSMNPDGSGQTNLTSNSASDSNPDWQPIPINAYPRPKGATPFLTYLVPAYNACASPNRVHGYPLAFASCNPPTQTSNELTVGSADSNGKPTKSVSSVRFDTLVGNPSTPADEGDVKITAQVIDVYTQAGLADYAGEVTAKTTLRITDKLNTPNPGGPGAGTVSDIPYGFTIPCAATADTTIGGSCLLSTSADAIAPGAVKEGKRSIWALGQVVVYDANDAPFMKQGILFP